MPDSKQKTILLVDDDESIRKFVFQILSRSYQVLVADSGDAASQVSREYEGKIDLLLSNVQMPGMTGIDLGAKLNQERPDMRVMLMSGYTSGMLILNAGWHFIHKPFIPAQLLELVASVLAVEQLTGDIDEHRRSPGDA